MKKKQIIKKSNTIDMLKYLYNVFVIFSKNLKAKQHITFKNSSGKRP